MGVAEGGNQTMVGVGCGVSVKRMGVGVAFNASSTAHELINPAIRVAMQERKNIMGFL
jgi:hypothetical protein